jgi:hypothetical protein
MFGLSVCRIEGRLLKAMHEELSNVERLEKDPSGCPAQARMTLVEVQIAWTQHRATCLICNKQFLN